MGGLGGEVNRTSRRAPGTDGAADSFLARRLLSSRGSAPRAGSTSHATDGQRGGTDDETSQSAGNRPDPGRGAGGAGDGPAEGRGAHAQRAQREARGPAPGG